MEKREVILRGMMILVALPALTSCQAGSRTSTRTITAEALATKYNVSAEAARREFDGKELVVKGYVLKSVAMPNGDESEGVILLSPGNKITGPTVECWFTRYESAEFAELDTGQSITVKGIFNGESGITLKFCKLAQAHEQ